MNKRQAKKAMNKAQNKPIKTQNDASKRIKRINTNIKAIGEKYGINSVQYATAIQQVTEEVGMNNVHYTKSGYLAIRNTKKTQSPEVQVRLKEVEKADETSIKNLQKASKQRLIAKGVKNPSRKEIESNTKYVAGFDYVLRNTDKWYQMSMESDELKRAKEILKTKGRKKTTEELEEVVQIVLEEVDRIEREMKEGAELAHNNHEGEITFDSSMLI